MARASRVLPVPGAPTMSVPRGMRPPKRWNLLGIAQELDKLLHIIFGFVHPGDIRERGLDLVLGQASPCSCRRSWDCRDPPCPLAPGA